MLFLVKKNSAFHLLKWLSCEAQHFSKDFCNVGYFVLRSTDRPIKCYAKILPKNQVDRDVISNTLQIHKIRLSDYIDVSRLIGIQTPSKLSSLGQQLTSQFPYSRICGISISPSELSTTISLSQSNSSYNSLPVVPRTTTGIMSNN